MRIGGNSVVQVQSGSAASSSAFATSDILSAMGRGQVFGGTIAGTAAASNKAICEIQNFGGSNTILFIYELEIWVPTTMAVQIVLNGTTLNPAGVPVQMLVGNGSTSVAKIGGGNQLAPTGTVVKTLPALVANTVFTFPQPFVLAVGQTNNVQIVGQTVNQAMTVNFTQIEWRS